MYPRSKIAYTLIHIDKLLTPLPHPPNLKPITSYWYERFNFILTSSKKNINLVNRIKDRLDGILTFCYFRIIYSNSQVDKCLLIRRKLKSFKVTENWTNILFAARLCSHLLVCLLWYIFTRRVFHQTLQLIEWEKKS